MDTMDLLENYIYDYIDSIEVIDGKIVSSNLSFEDWKKQRKTEIRCVKNGQGIRFEVPPGENPKDYAKKKLEKMYKKRPYNWEYQEI